MNKIKNINLIHVIMLLAPALMGCVSLWSNSIIAILCIIGIVIKILKNKRIVLPKGKEIVLLCVYVFSFLIVQFWAVDKGMNMLNFIKNITIILFVILMVQYNFNKEEKIKLLSLIPYSGILILILSLLCLNMGNVVLNNRFHGIFEYANTYALFQAIGIIILLMKEKTSKWNVVMILALWISIIYTNCRAIIILTLFFAAISFILNKVNRKNIALISIGMIILFIVIYNYSGLEKRLNSDMFESGEFQSRLVYYKDSLELIKQNPFGYGYLGFCYKQAEMQSMEYSSMFVHSSILQIIVDVGIIPMIALSVLFCSAFFDKNQTKLTRLIFLFVIGHSVIDIDLEYMCFIYLICFLVNFDQTTTILFTKDKKTSKKLIVGTSMLMICGYFIVFMSSLSESCKDYKSAYNLIPFYTKALENDLYSPSTHEEHMKLSNKIYSLNKNVSGVYEAFRKEELRNLNYKQALIYEKERMRLNRYSLEDYEYYISLLSQAMVYFKMNNDSQNLNECMQEVLIAERNMKEFGVAIPKDLREYIDMIKSEVEVS